MQELIDQISPDEMDLTGFGGQELTELLRQSVDKIESETKEENTVCDHPIIARVLESYKYVVIITDNLLDFTALCEQVKVAPAQNENGYRMPGRIIWYKDFLAALEANKGADRYERETPNSEYKVVGKVEP